ncbi:MAG TPA: SMP-30/gluconolactonase/LRE family protein [Kineosporiaceae bacterium]|nr:SMP-30/gluconolactonase/LRE family protein [Kineosporiaceae bacterium]
MRVLSFGEAPRWREGRLWFSDFYRRAVYAVGLDGSKVVDVPDQPSGLGWLPDGRLLVVSMKDRRVLRLEPGGGLVEHTDLSGLATFHANDMLVDASGAAWVGNFGYDLYADLRARELAVMLGDESAGQAVLARVGSDGVVSRAADDLRFPNGMALLDGGRTLVVAETLRLQLTAFDVADDGTLGGRRVYAGLGQLFVAPDGICADPGGGVWVANALGPRVLRVADGGRVTDTVTTTQPAFACALGGDDRRTLFVMTAPSSEPWDVEGKTLAKIETANV